MNKPHIKLIRSTGSNVFECFGIIYLNGRQARVERYGYGFSACSAYQSWKTGFIEPGVFE